MAGQRADREHISTVSSGVLRRCSGRASTQELCPALADGNPWTPLREPQTLRHCQPARPGTNGPFPLPQAHPERAGAWTMRPMSAEQQIAGNDEVTADDCGTQGGVSTSVVQPTRVPWLAPEAPGSGHNSLISGLK